jgi:hypothetical protein
MMTAGGAGRESRLHQPGSSRVDAHTPTSVVADWVAPVKVGAG